jgi:truncated hemoglobin YjbI
MADPPSLYEWAGGADAFSRLINAFYDRVENDDLLSPFFPGGSTKTTGGVARVSSHDSCP